jgi:hypothetical protein
MEVSLGVLLVREIIDHRGCSQPPEASVARWTEAVSDLPLPEAWRAAIRTDL